MKTFNILAVIYVCLIISILLLALFTRSAEAESKQIYREQGYVVDQSEFSDDEVDSAENILTWYSQYTGEQAKKAAEVFDSYVENISTLTVEDYTTMDRMIQAK